MRKVSILLIAFSLAAGPAQAIPALQLYIPDSAYNTETESWLTSENPFTLQVLGTGRNGSLLYLTDLLLDVTVPVDFWRSDGSVTLTGPGYPDGITLSTFDLGTPARQTPHGVYPAYYYSLRLPDMDLAAGNDIVQNYNPDGENASAAGVILEYTVAYTGFEALYFDASALALNKHEKWSEVRAPYSHDAQADPPRGSNPPVSEPSSITLLAAAGLIRALRRRA